MRDSSDRRGLGEKRRLALGLSAGLAVLVVIAFWPAFSAQFLNFDDDVLFTSNHSWRGLGATQLEWMWRTNLMGHFIPLTWTSFGLDHALHGLSEPNFGEAPWYHATNVVLHVLTALAFSALALKLIELGAPTFTRTERVWSAALAACAWAVHPMRVESVVWLTERRDVLCGLFFVLAALSWLAWAEPRRVAPRARAASVGIAALTLVAIVAGLAALDLSSPAGLSLRSPVLLIAALCAWFASIVIVARGSIATRRWALIIACLCLLLSLLSKASSMVLPAVLIVLDVWPLRRWRRADVLALVIEKLPMLALAVVFGRIAFWAQRTGVTRPLHLHALSERIGQVFYGLCYYPAKTLGPVNLLPMYDFPRRLSLSDPRWFIPIVVVLVVSFRAFALRRRLPALLASWCAFGLIIAPVLGVVQSGPQLVADRYSYLACMPFTLLLSAVVVWFARRRHSVIVFVAVLMGASIVGTWRQAKVWRTSTTLWERAYAIEPRSPTNLQSIGALRSLAADLAPDRTRAMQLLDEANEFYERAFTFDEDPVLLRSRSQVQTRLADVDAEHAERHLADALELSRRALELAQRKGVFTPEYRLDYGTDLLNAGRLEEGIEQLMWFVEMRPQSARGLSNLGGALVLAGKYEQALGYLERASRLQPSDARTWSSLAATYRALGRAPEAGTAEQRAADLQRRP